MSKYTKEFKLKIVIEHEEQGISARALQKKYGPDKNNIRQWIAQYEQNGKLTEPSRSFSGEFKLKVLNYQQEHNLSDYQTALVFEITKASTVSAWRKKYIAGGAEALFTKQGRKIKMPKKSLIPNKPREEWTEQEELAYLRMENAYLKKYLALVQEEEKQKQQQEKEKSRLSEN